MVGDGIVNIFTEDTDINIIKSWLVGSTDGQTYSINERFLKRINGLDMNFDCIESAWDDIIGYKHDYKIDDPKLDEIANDILKNLNEFIEKVNKDPQNYFGGEMKKYIVHLSAVVDNAIEFSCSSEEEAKSFAMSRGGALLSDKCLDGVGEEWHWDGNINIEGIECK